MDDLGRKAIDPINDLLSRMNANTVFGAAVTEGETTIIPTAHIAYGFGYGFGGQPGAESEQAGSQGAGSGGGGWASPTGYIQISPDGVAFHSTPNQTLLGIAGILMGAWSVFWGVLMIRSIAQVIGRRKAG